jgi:hypothetical protein
VGLSVPTKPINQQFQASVTLDASGGGSAQITMRADFLLQRSRWLVQGGTAVNGVRPQATVENYINDVPFEGSQSGNNDQSGSIRLLTTQSTITAEWTGGPPGGAATLYVWGIEYPAGQGMAALSGGAGALYGGEGPGNPILGGNTLIRDAIQSSNYVPGVSGWAIFTDGSMDMNSGTFRGIIDVVGTNMSEVKIYDKTTGINESTAIIEMFPGVYQDGHLPLTDSATITTSAISGSTHYGQTVITSSGYNFASSMWLVGQSDESRIAGTNDTQAYLFGATVNLGIDTKSDIQIGGTSIGYGWVAGGGATAPVTVAATDAAVVSLDNAFLFRAGRRYRVVMTASGTMTAANRTVQRLHKGVGVAGTQLALSGSQFVNTGTGNHNWETTFYCTTANDVLTNLTWSGTTGAAAPTATYQPNPAITIDVYDLGPSNATQRAYLQQLS